MNQAKQAIEVLVTEAAQQNSAELRYEYQLARAMEAEVPEKAVEIYKKLAGKGYPAAYDNLGSLMVKLYKNYGAAITYFKTGSQLRDPDSMVSLAELIDNGYVQTDRPYELKYQLLRTAADLGHQGAQLQIQEEKEKLSPAQRQAAPQENHDGFSRGPLFRSLGLSSAELDGHIRSWSPGRIQAARRASGIRS